MPTGQMLRCYCPLCMISDSRCAWCPGSNTHRVHMHMGPNTCWRTVASRCSCSPEAGEQGQPEAGACLPGLTGRAAAQSAARRRHLQPAEGPARRCQAAPGPHFQQACQPHRWAGERSGACSAAALLIQQRPDGIVLIPIRPLACLHGCSCLGWTYMACVTLLDPCCKVSLAAARCRLQLQPMAWVMAHVAIVVYSA